MTQLELCNVALGHLGEARIAALSDATAAARACSLHYAPVRDEVLRSHRWNFAMKRVLLELVWSAVEVITQAGTEVLISSTEHGLATGDRVHVKGIVGANGDGTWYVTKDTDDTFSLDGSVYSGAGTIDAGSLWIKAPPFGWDYMYALPEDCLRCLEVNDSEAGDWISDEWIIEGRSMLTNADEVRLVYVRSVGDEALTDPLFAQAFGLKLAVALTETIRGSTGKTADLLQVYQNVTAPLARRVDANEGRRRKGMLPMNSRFIRSRFTGT